MSRRAVIEMVRPLPWKLREDMADYASFVTDVADERAAELGLELTEHQRDQVILVTSVIHLRDIVAGQLSLAEMAARGPSLDAVHEGQRPTGLRIGSQEIYPDSPYIVDLRRLRQALDEQLADAGVPRRAHTLSDVIKLCVTDE